MPLILLKRDMNTLRMLNMGKGCAPRPGHNAEKQSRNHDEIDWSKKGKDRKIIVRVNGKRIEA